MASASSNASPAWKYDVFLSFRGKDTRNNFTSHLYAALCNKGVKTFIDDELKRGEEITPALLRTIEESRIAVVIFSENYASSSWCVEELVKILECKQDYGQIVLPVFYHVDPSDVYEQTGSFGKAFADLEKKFGGTMDKVPTWRDDLTKAANISGWDSQIVRPDSKLASDIVQHILKELNCTSVIYSRGLVGMNSYVEQIVKLLCIDEESSVRIIGMWGMRGIGKTTMAKSFFSSVSHQYGGHCFLENVGQKANEPGGLTCLQEKFLSKILCEESLQIDTAGVIPSFIRERLRCLKVLAVLDDVNDVRQLEGLIGGHDSFGPGSRIIVITQDRQVLGNHVDREYEVKGLNDKDALRLFCLNAFGKNQPQGGFRELSMQAINYAKGNPFALKVLGSSLYGKKIQIWESALSETGWIPMLKILDGLRNEYEELHDKVKSVFLDVACFFEGQQVDFVKTILDRRGFSTETLFPILVDKSLLSISNNKLEMHDLVKEMAHEIVRQEPSDTSSRFWSAIEVYDVLTKNMGTKSVTGIFADVSKVQVMELSSQTFECMHNLRLLKLYNSGVGGNNHRVSLPHGLTSLPDALRYLRWDGFPLKSLPSKFSPKNLVVLNLSDSSIEHLWKGDQSLVNLKEINLSNCKNLTTVPDLKTAARLEILNLQYCSSLESVPLCIGSLDYLIDLDLRQCTNLKRLPSSFNSRSLKTLNLAGCSIVEKYPETKGDLTYLNLNETAIVEVPQAIENLTSLVCLNLKNCRRLENLPSDISLLKSLEILDLSECSSIRMLPDLPKNIKHLYLNGIGVEKLPVSVGCLQSLSYLHLINCKIIKDLPKGIFNFNCLEKLNLSGCSSISEFPPVPWCIKELYLDGTELKEIPSSIEHCPRLVELHLKQCVSFEVLPSSICKLKSLQRLNLSGCCDFQNFPEIPEKMDCLRYLYLDGTAVRGLPMPIQNLCNLASLELGNCWNLNILAFAGGDLKLMRKLCLDGCGLDSFPDSIFCLSSLEALDLRQNLFDSLPAGISALVELQYLGLRDCRRLTSLPELPPKLTKLDARGCRSLREYSRSSANVEGNIFDFLFTNCWSLDESACNNIMSYAMKKIQLYSKRLHSQLSYELEGTCSFFFPAMEIPKWFEHEASGSSLTIQLPSHGASSEFFGFILCATVSYKPVFNESEGFQVKCTYVFKNSEGEIRINSDLGGWYPCKDEKSIRTRHLLFGYDPCMSAKEVIWCGRYSEVLIEFCTEDMNNKPLSSCEVVQSGVRLHTQHEGYYDDLLMLDPVDLFIVYLSWLETLDLSKTKFEILPESISKLTELKCLVLRNCTELTSLPELPPKLTKLDAHGCLSLREYSRSSCVVEGNIFNFLFTRCPSLNETACNNIMSYAMKKIQLYSKKIHSQASNELKGTCSFYIPEEIPMRFQHEAVGSSLTIQLPWNRPINKFFGFILCAIVDSDDISGGFRVKCRYQLKNNDGDNRQYCSYLGGWHPYKREPRILRNHMLVGYDPFLGATKHICSGRYTEMLIELCLEDMRKKPLRRCRVRRSGVRLYTLHDDDEYSDNDLIDMFDDTPTEVMLKNNLWQLADDLEEPGRKRRRRQTNVELPLPLRQKPNSPF